MRVPKNAPPLRKIEAIVSPAKLDQIRKAVMDMGVVHGMTVQEVLDLDPRNRSDSSDRGRAHAASVAPRVRIEIAVDAEWAEAVLLTICRASDTRLGQGEDRIMVLPMEDAIRIRTGEHGQGVL